MLLVKDIIRDVKSVAPDATCVGFHRETEAILYAKHHSIDVALLDIDMPIMNGLLVAEHRLRKRLSGQAAVPGGAGARVQ